MRADVKSIFLNNRSRYRQQPDVYRRGINIWKLISIKSVSRSESSRGEKTTTPTVHIHHLETMRKRSKCSLCHPATTSCQPRHSTGWAMRNGRGPPLSAGCGGELCKHYAREETILRDTADHCEQCSAMKTLHSASDIALGFRIIIWSECSAI